MKKSLVLGILGLATAAVTSHGVGAIFLDNYFFSTYNPVCLPAWFGGGLAPAGFTVGLYYDPVPNQDITGSVAFDPTGLALPTSLNPAFVRATGPGSTATIGHWAPAGYFYANTSFLIQPVELTPPQASYTIMVVMYNGADYASSTARGHSAPVYIQDAAPTIPAGADVGLAFPPNVPMIGVIPEPTTMALSGLAGLSLWLLRRKQS